MEPWDLEAVGVLRGAVYRADAEAVIDVLAPRDPVEVKQLAVDGLLVATADERLATEAVALLAELVHHRMGAEADGDVALVVQVDVVLDRVGRDRVRHLQRILHAIDPRVHDELPDADDELPELRPVAVDLDELSIHLEAGSNDPWGGSEWRLDLTTGQLWSREIAHEAGVDLPDHWEDPGAWLRIDPVGSGPAWPDMEDFALELDDGELGERLHEAIQGSGAFRRFHRLLDDEPDARVPWQIMAEQRRLGRARGWLVRNHCRPELPGIDRPRGV